MNQFWKINLSDSVIDIILTEPYLPNLSNQLNLPTQKDLSVDALQEQAQEKAIDVGIYKYPKKFD